MATEVQKDVQPEQRKNIPHDAQAIQITITEATELCQNALQKAGYLSEQAAIITDHLVDAELRGHPFAGLARALSIVEFLKSAGVKADQEIEVTRTGPTYAHLDGHDSVGYLVAHQATKLAIEKAKCAGVSVVGANGLWYSGNLAYYAEMATREDLIVLIASNGTPIVAPYGGYEPKFCTNPFCIGFPTNEPDKPVIWDIGTSNIMYAQVKLAERLGAPLPEGSAYDSGGKPTTDPLQVLNGALTVWGGYKGSGLAIMVQLLGIAAGSTEPTPFLSDFGFLIMAFDPSILQSLDRVKQDAEKLSNSIRSTKMLPGEGPARMPFERSSELRRRARAKGSFEVSGRVVEQLRSQGW
ncbi:uncharacterized protein A1O5_07885 [Cladophialophora psammophila CBS 110553]|uniref:Lactate dehydrogenase n=1 Tax=Cladophialophora psammophila CBS 110553 TaxID=1182543 RepID=W9WM54_9EURO|nr:uncharacterized protein A1O5_07885 [Cladophialophora psammophila CBS 110553]EXJ68953.1 hypothetical protein A1O5_07885 [Cladophialophora psammophila CBS 110553]